MASDNQDQHSENHNPLSAFRDTHLSALRPDVRGTDNQAQLSAFKQEVGLY